MDEELVRELETETLYVFARGNMDVPGVYEDWGHFRTDLGERAAAEIRRLWALVEGK